MTTETESPTALRKRARLAIDLGKTSCRVRVVLGDHDVFSCEGPGAPGFADFDGRRLALQAIENAVSTVPAPILNSIDCIGIGAAGVDANRESARYVAEQLSSTLNAPAAVLTDVLIAHIGALGGRPGTVLVAGTGAVAYGLDEGGVLSRADGWGMWLGDDGSGRWIGQEGLKSVLRASDGRGAATSLTAAAVDVAGSLDRLPVYVSGTGQPGRVLASFAPVVLAHADAGDAVASAIVAQAVELLTETATAVAKPDDAVCVLGGLMNSPMLAERLLHSLAAQRLRVTRPSADALTGAAMIASRTDLPHERYAIRV